MRHYLRMVKYRWNPLQRLIRAALRIPDGLVTRLAGEPVELDGRVLNRSVQLLITLAERLDQNALEGESATQRREDLRRITNLGMPKVEGLHVTDRRIPGPHAPIRIRIYRPFDLEPNPSAIVHYHGGGWVVGDLDTHDRSARVLAIRSGCVVIAVDYRLAPEHPFPAPGEDAVAAYEWITMNAGELSINPDAVAVMGDSAGGNLAAVVAQLARHRDSPDPIAQGLLYPATDFRLQTPSMELFGEGFFLTRESIEWFKHQYIPDDVDSRQPLLSPLLADNLEGVAPAWVWTAGFDPLRDEGRNYADALEKAGVVTNYRCYDDQVHGFFGMGVVPGGMELIEEVSVQMGRFIRAQIQLREVTKR